MPLLFSLPPGLLEHEICQFLDAPSLARISCANHELHGEIIKSKHWGTHVAQNFGIAVTKIISGNKMASLPSPPAPKRTLLSPPPRALQHHQQKESISWRDVFLAAWMDSLSLASAVQDNDILQVYHRHPQVLLSAPESKIRDEIVLVQGLRRFPSSSSLLSLYAQVIRQELVVRIR
uniref:F-box domain-containing protein n=1 Tax=Globisporangium ultimum (strain ATCC 200006 / CBS 805.95 / DAOM BR144) TaxID=431595 RepID=K3WV70_GLOUD